MKAQLSFRALFSNAKSLSYFQGSYRSEKRMDSKQTVARFLEDTPPIVPISPTTTCPNILLA